MNKDIDYLVSIFNSILVLICVMCIWQLFILFLFIVFKSLLNDNNGILYLIEALNSNGNVTNPGSVLYLSTYITILSSK